MVSDLGCRRTDDLGGPEGGREAQLRRGNTKIGRSRNSRNSSVGRALMEGREKELRNGNKRATLRE